LKEKKRKQLLGKKKELKKYRKEVVAGKTKPGHKKQNDS
jgi:hypothetical protein